MRYSVKGNYVDVFERTAFPAEVFIVDGRIEKILGRDDFFEDFILPGIVDSHVHIESSMLIPQEFARLAVTHGTVASVSDPHEIANVLGLRGVDFMIDDGKRVPFKFYFGAPSCVPATAFESSGFELNSADVESLLQRDEIKYLSEMMNFPGVVYGDKEVALKLAAAKKASKPIDGHAPGLKGESLMKYAAGGITTDHESVCENEAIDKIKLGIKLQIREGSAAKNFEALWPVLIKYPDDVMLCTDDCHPDDLIEKHILQLVKRAVDEGVDFFDAFRSATVNPVEHYKLDVGLLRVGDKADFIIVNNLQELNVLETYIDGECVYSENRSLIETKSIDLINNFNRTSLSIDDILIKDIGKNIQVIVAKDGDLYTAKEIVKPKVDEGSLVSDVENDVLKIVVVNRYNNSKPVVGFIKNFGLKKGAIAGSVAHDSHNIIAVGVCDVDILNAINKVVEHKGAIVALNGDEILDLALPIAGLMSNENAEIVADKYKKLNAKAKEWGSTLHAPFMTLSFMALLVIPELKIGDKYLFDGLKFSETSLFV
ncbi:MAG: adenine deaminase [Bacteroidales bacterium]|nr:adenine deaminase [Bacteroidales bacterium]MBN2758179.1 adenine deaminase [Bacteroidales bacterium]